MLSPNQVNIYIFRTNMVLDNLRNFNSGQDIHKIANIRHLAVMMLDTLRTDSTISSVECDRIIQSIELKCVDFFRQKYCFLQTR